MSGSLTRGGGKTFPAFPAHVQPSILFIWHKAHVPIIQHVRSWYPERILVVYMYPFDISIAPKLIEAEWRIYAYAT